MNTFPADFNDAIVALPLSNSPEICLVNFSDYIRAIKYHGEFACLNNLEQ